MAVTLVFLAACRGPHGHEPKSATFWNTVRPYSADPIDADEIVNAIAFGPVRATLVDNGRKGRVLGVLAESWETDDSFTRWRFVFRKGLTYETGEAIRPKDMLAALNRLRALMRKRGSANPVFEDLAAEDGLTCDEGSLTFRFRKAHPKLLNQLADGLFSLAHPSCYDAASGEWRCGTKPVASGPFRVSRSDDADIELRLREDFPAELRHPEAFQSVRIVSGRANRDDADIAHGLSREVDHPTAHTFVGGMDSAIVFMRCQSWSKKGSPCHSRNGRVALREAYYRALEGSGFRTAKSFFPLSIPGINTLTPPPIPPSPPRIGTVLFRPAPGPTSFLVPSNDALRAAVKGLGGTPLDNMTSGEQVHKELAPGLARYENDLVYFMTEITLDEPRASVRFMFTSKEGIRLPDPTGRAAGELRREDFDLQRINEILWDDAIIWPVAHAGFGIWVKPRIDISLANSGTVVTPLHWIGSSN